MNLTPMTCLDIQRHFSAERLVRSTRTQKIVYKPFGELSNAMRKSIYDTSHVTLERRITLTLRKLNLWLQHGN